MSCSPKGREWATPRRGGGLDQVPARQRLEHADVPADGPVAVAQVALALARVAVGAEVDVVGVLAGAADGADLLDAVGGAVVRRDLAEGVQVGLRALDDPDQAGGEQAERPGLFRS